MYDRDKDSVEGVMIIQNRFKKSKMQSWTFLILTFIIESRATNFCTEMHICSYTCYAIQQSSTTCWFLFIPYSCSQYRVVSTPCPPCYRQTCCQGYTGNRCETPLCDGEITCQNGGTCVEVDTCICREGYDGDNCENDINECEQGTSDCHQVCSNTNGSFTCSCNNGYALLPDLKNCYDVNECLTNNGGCPDHCENTEGSYSCSCPKGFTWNGLNCEDVDECSSGDAQCTHECRNTIGSYVCHCPDRLYLSKEGFKCEDVDECLSGDNGCQHYCNNTFGSYGCVCKSGFLLNSDERTCKSINKCLLDNGGCDQLCRSQDGRHECSCDTGFRLNFDGKTCQDIDECKENKDLCNGNCENTPGSFHCNCLPGFVSTTNGTHCEDIDDCIGNTCINNGTCDDGIEAYTCRCTEGYTGSFCESDIDECEILHGGCEEKCINSIGSYTCACMNDVQLHSDGRSCSENGNITYQLLPVGCHRIGVPVNHNGQSYNLSFVSTTPWYSLEGSSRMIATTGIVSIEASSEAIPFSLYGAKINTEKGKVFPGGNMNLNMSNIMTEEVESQDCAPAHPNATEMFVMTRFNSYLYTFLSSLDQSKPDWIDFEVLGRGIPDILESNTLLLSGSDIDSISDCKGIPLFPDRIYAVYLFSSAFILHISNESITFSNEQVGTKFCMIRDVGLNDGSLYLNVPEGAQLSILPHQIFHTIYKLFGIKVYLRGIGVSMTDGIRVDEDVFETKLWNGDHFFNYRQYLHADIWISGESTIEVFGGIIEMKGKMIAYFSVPDPNEVFTSTFIDRWDMIFMLDSYIGYTINYGDFSFKFAPISSTLDVFMSLGGSNSRTICGSSADPPGIFFKFNVQANPFKNIPLLEEHIGLDITSTIYSYFLVGENRTFTSEQIHELKNVLSDLKLTASKVKTNVLSISSTVPNRTFISLLIAQVHNLSSLLDNGISNLHNRNVQEISFIVQGISENVAIVYRMGNRILREIKANEISMSSINNSNFDDMKKSLVVLNREDQTLVSIISFHLTESLHWKSGVGFKFRGYFSLIEIAGGYGMEFVYSEDDLFGCSRFKDIASFFEGERSFKVLSIGEAAIPFKKYFEIDVGRGIGFGVSLTSKRFVYRIHGFASFLGMIGVTADIFITKDGLYTYTQGNIFDIFFAELDINATGLTKGEDTTFRIVGRFVANARRKRQIQKDTSSFTTSYGKALVKAVEKLAEDHKERLDDMKEAVEFAEKGVKAAKNWLMDRLDDLTNAKNSERKSRSILGNAKEILREARSSLEVVISRLNSAQRAVDNLCKIRVCSTICIPGIKCSICWEKLWIFRVPYPCCSFTNCMLRVPDPLCLAANGLCFIVRQAAYLALELAKRLIRLPMLAVDAARVALTVAQVAVGEAEIVTGLAEIAKIAANTAFEGAIDFLQLAKRHIELQKDFVDLATPIVQAFIENIIQRSVDIRNCGFQLMFQLIEPKIFEIECEVNLLSSGWKRIGFKINFNNIAQSLWEAARSTANAILIGTNERRKRRDAAFMIYTGTHKLIRRIRSVQDLKAFNETVNIFDNIKVLNVSQNEFDFRVSNFDSKCKIIDRHKRFLEETLLALNNISERAKSSLESLNTFHRSIKDLDINGTSKNASVEEIGLNITYGVHFNLSKDEIEAAIDIGRESVSTDPTIVQVVKTVASIKDNTEKEMHSLQSHGFANQWINHLENITRSYYNTSECISFRDCVLFLIGEIMELYEEEIHANTTEIKNVLLNIEDDIFGIVKNTSFDIIGIYEKTSGIKESLKTFSTLNIYCKKPPTFIVTPHNITSSLGGNATLYCRVVSDPEPEFWWLKAGEYIPNEKTNKLTLKNISAKDVTSYQCKAGNVVANITSDAIYVSVKEEISLCERNNGGCEQICSIDVNVTRCSCHTGFLIDPNSNNECVDINECEKGTHGCHQICSNTYGSYACSCQDGFSLESDLVLCKKIPDECEEIGLNCSKTSGCETNVETGPSCFCSPGYILTENDTKCEDIDECTDDICDQGCKNTVGGFECFCNDGFEKDTETTCKVCSNGFWGPDCSNPCGCANAIRCDKATGCVCEEGWEGEFCSKDIDECLTQKCEDANAECWNYDGSFMCICSEGYIKDNNGICVDFIDCTGFSTKCNQLCFEIEGKQICSCLDGYSLDEDNSTCVECPLGKYGYLCQNNCDCLEKHTKQCSSVNGECKCMPGWSGARCDIDIDECSTVSSNVCPPDSRCINTEGEYACICNENHLRTLDSCIYAGQSLTSINVTVVLDIQLPQFDGLDRISVEYDQMLIEVELTLLSAYSRYLNNFNVVLKSVRRGSIIVEHEVKTEEEYDTALYNALLNLWTGNPSLTFHGRTVDVLSVSINDVYISEDHDVCDIANALSKCKESQTCIVKGGQPHCLVQKDGIIADSSSRNKYTAIIVGSTVAFVFVVAIIVFVVVLCKARNKSDKYWVNRLKNRIRCCEEEDEVELSSY